MSNLDDGTVSVTPPRFLTHVRDNLVATDLTSDQLEDDALHVLRRFEELGFDVPSLAEEMRIDATELWLELVDATEQLGAPSVAEAAAVVGFGTPQYA